MVFRKTKEEFKQAESALKSGNPQEAFAYLRDIVEYPGNIDSDKTWKELASIFSKISKALGANKLASISRIVSKKPNMPSALYNFGFQLIEEELHGFAATVLTRANFLEPGVENTVTELVHALEQKWLNSEALNVLEKSGLIESSWICKYLSAFHMLMCADVESATAVFPSLIAEASSDEERDMAGRIEGMVNRAQGIAMKTSLDDQDLRGWHFVINGSILLHLSPYGFDEGMNGRYAYVQDAEERCRQGILTLSATMDAMNLHPSRVYTLKERNSAILGCAAGELLDLPTTHWSHNAEGGGAPTEPGLIIVYDMADLDMATFESLCLHRPGQILYVHATCWTSPPPFAADFTTFLYQINTSPWAERPSLEGGSKTADKIEKRSEAAEILAKEVVNAEEDEELLSKTDRDKLHRFAISASSIKDDGPGALQVSGERRRQWKDSPVKSSRFLS